MSHPLLLARSSEALHQPVHDPHHAVVVTLGILSRLQMMAPGSRTLQEDLPRALQIRHPSDCIPQSPFIFSLLAMMVRTNSGDPMGVPKNLNA